MIIIFCVLVFACGFCFGYGIGKLETHRIFKKMFPYLYDHKDIRNEEKKELWECECGWIAENNQCPSCGAFRSQEIQDVLITCFKCGGYHSIYIPCPQK